MSSKWLLFGHLEYRKKNTLHAPALHNALLLHTKNELVILKCGNIISDGEMDGQIDRWTDRHTD